MMPAFRLRPLRLIALALLGSLMVLGAAITAVVALWQPRPLEAMLPAEGTVAFFSNVTREDLRAWSDRFSDLRSVPVFEGRLELGILDLGNGSRGWILSSPVEDIRLPEENGNYRGQPVLLSDSGVMGRMMDATPRLRAGETFRELSRGIPSGATRIYLRSSEGEASTALPAALRPFIHASGGLLLSRQGETARVRVYGKPAIIHGSAPAGVTAVSPTPDLTLVLAAPVQMFDLGLLRFPDTERLIRRGQLLRKINDVLGGEWSLEYDILPLFKEPSTLHWRTGTGSLPSFAFQGRLSPRGPTRPAVRARDAESRLAAFHESLHRRTVGSAVVRRTFDRGFTSVILRSNPSQTQERTYRLHGWTVRETADGDRLLMSAVRGRDVVIANDARWMENMLQGAPDILLPTLSGPPVAGGRLSTEAFARQEIRRMPSWTWLLNDFPADRPVLWSLEDDGQALTLSLTLSPP